MKISIITPSFNQAAFIDKTIQSVLSQHYKAYEYLVVDGASSDNTQAILKMYEKNVVTLSEPDLGQAHAVNKGILRTTGDIIGWLNSDDLYYPHTLQKVSDFFHQHPDVDVLYGQTYHINKDDQLLDLYPTCSWNIDLLKIHCFISQPATFFRKRVIEKYGYFNEQLKFCLDYEYWLRIGLANVKFAYLPEILAASRIHANSKSSLFYLEAHFETITMLQNKLGYIPAEWIVNYATAKTKTELRVFFPHPKFIYRSWLTLWHTAGLHNKGVAQFLTWINAQQMMFRKFFRKLFKKYHTT